MMMGMMGATTMSFTVDTDVSMADAIAITIELEGDARAASLHFLLDWSWLVRIL